MHLPQLILTATTSLGQADDLPFLVRWIAIIPALIWILLGCLLIAYGRLLIRRARRLRAQTPGKKTWPRRLSGWTLSFLGFLAILIGVIHW